MNKIDEYISNESQRQFSSEKRAEIERSKLGHSHLGDSLEADYAREIATRKGRNAVECAGCGKPTVVPDIRKRPHLCNLCEPHRHQITKYLDSYHTPRLSEEDITKIRKTRTVAVGPFGSPANNWLKKK